MTIEYAETFEVGGIRLGIQRTNDEKKPWSLWSGGSKLGDTETVEQARGVLATHAETRLRTERAALLARLNVIDAELKELVLHPAGILHFVIDYKVKP